MDNVHQVSLCEQPHTEERDRSARRSRSRVLSLGGHAARTPPLKSKGRSSSRERRPDCGRASRSRGRAEARQAHQLQRSRSRSRSRSHRRTSRSPTPASECSQRSVILGRYASRCRDRRHDAYYQRRSQSRS